MSPTYVSLIQTSPLNSRLIQSIAYLTSLLGFLTGTLIQTCPINSLWVSLTLSTYCLLHLSKWQPHPSSCAGLESFLTFIFPSTFIQSCSSLNFTPNYLQPDLLNHPSKPTTALPWYYTSFLPGLPVFTTIPSQSLLNSASRIILLKCMSEYAIPWIKTLPSSPELKFKVPKQDFKVLHHLALAMSLTLPPSTLPLCSLHSSHTGPLLHLNTHRTFALAVASTWTTLPPEGSLLYLLCLCVIFSGRSTLTTVFTISISHPGASWFPSLLYFSL